MSTIQQERHPPRTILDAKENRHLLSWITSVDHKQIGLMYMVTSLTWFCIAATIAVFMRVQLTRPDLPFLSPVLYDQLFTMHGTTMIFLVATPLILGLSVYLVPLMIGARDMAFPRWNAFAYWTYLFGSIMLWFSFLAGGATAVGWFAYAPLTEKAYSPGPGVTYWALSLFVMGMGTTSTAVNLLTTILTLRVRGMTMRRMPMFVWMILVNSVMIIQAFPTLSGALSMIFLDREVGTFFFRTTFGGSALLWQNLFWVFGHPEVYILILPAFGVLSEVIPVFSRKVIYGYGFMVGSTIAIGILSMWVWIHHMFATGIAFYVIRIFAATSVLIAVPTGIKIFNWLATMYRGSIQFSMPMLFSTAFLIQFTIGGCSGVTFAAVPLDWQLTDSYFVVAHIHYVLLGGTMFGLMGGIYFWYPKMTGRMLSERLGKVHFWMMVIGFNGTFFVMHVLGSLGLPRRTYMYLPRPSLIWLNTFSAVFAFVLVTSIAIFIFNLFYSLRKGAIAGPNPWNAWNLEWATDSPPPSYNFVRVPPVRGRRPLWDLSHPGNTDYEIQKRQGEL